ncbi:helix-turn-helix domain-containing protein [Gordonibacter sp. An230]|uniref:helix-turn-helix domain-containing protein n=1 Tax=Gordonibacter sp. An230 TaxID=1965592 RepID=UPI0013A61FFA
MRRWNCDEGVRNRNPTLPDGQLFEDLSELPPVLKIRQAAWALQLSERFVRELCATGTIEAVKIGAVWRIPRHSLIAFAEGARNGQQRPTIP